MNFSQFPGFDEFLHPLSNVHVINTDEGKKETMNSWLFASLTWYQIVTVGNSKAFSLGQAIFNDSPRFYSLLEKSRKTSNPNARKAAILEAISVLASNLEQVLSDAFQK